jgi:hypothetical protein
LVQKLLVPHHHRRRLKNLARAFFDLVQVYVLVAVSDFAQQG